MLQLDVCLMMAEDVRAVACLNTSVSSPCIHGNYSVNLLAFAVLFRP